MEITLERAMTREDSGHGACELCGVAFEPRPVIVRIGPWYEEICGECVRALLAGRGEVPAGWPTWERYQEALREHPEPMMTPEELDRAEELGLYHDFYEAAQLK